MSNCSKTGENGLKWAKQPYFDNCTIGWREIVRNLKCPHTFGTNLNVLCFHFDFVFILFFIKVDIRLAEENLRARRFFDPTSYDKVTAVAQSKLVQAHQSALTSECKQMVQAMKTTGMSKSLASV